MADWKTPKTDYKLTDQVKPEIFNDLGENEIHLKEISCHVETQSKSGTAKTLNAIVLVEV